jgi:uncharacterized protein with HEPN domain
LWDIVDAVESIMRFIGTRTFEQFESDDMLQNAVAYKLFIVGEAVANLSDELIAKYPEVPWHEIKGFRNFMAHRYFKVSWDIIWKTAKIHAPDLAEHVKKILKMDFPHIDPEKL